MYRGLINTLSYMYAFLCRGRGKLSEADMRSIAEGAHTMTRSAQDVIGSEELTGEEDRRDLAECRKIDEHIDEMYTFLSHMEIF